MARRRIGLFGVGLAALAFQLGIIVWRGGTLVRSDAGPGGDLGLPLAWTTLGIGAAWVGSRRGLSALALWLGAAFWLFFAVLLWLQALAGKPLMV